MRWLILFVVVQFALAGCAGSGSPLQMLSGSELDYPAEARRQGIEGHVLVGYDVDVEGSVRNARVLDAAPPGVFDAAALKTVGSWRFRPKRVNGEPVPVSGLSSKVTFQLGKSKRYEGY